MSDEIGTTDITTIHLNADQAIVLFDFLTERVNLDEAPAPTAEAAVLDAILGQLEVQLAAPFCADYNLLLSAARSRLASEEDD